MIYIFKYDKNILKGGFVDYNHICETTASAFTGYNKVSNYDCIWCPVSDDDYAVVPNGVTELGDSCFQFCRYLQNVTIPNTVTIIEDNCFDGCWSLKNITTCKVPIWNERFCGHR